MLLDKIMTMHTNNKGYTLLFAVIVSVLVLSIAAFILSVSRKQAILSSSARDSIYAFYAADSGLECAIKNIEALSDPAAAATFDIQCGSGVAATHIGDGAAGTTTFSMPTNSDYNPSSQTQSGISSCASTTVSYVRTEEADVSTDPDTGETTVISPAEYQVIIEARGYNIGWNGSNCSAPGSRKVERALRYVQG